MMLMLLGVVCTHLVCFGGVVVQHLPQTSEVNGSNPRPCVGKLVVAYLRSAVYSINL